MTSRREAMQKGQLRVTTRLAIAALATLGTSTAFSAGVVAGAALNGRVVAFSVAEIPMALLVSPTRSPVNTHIR